MLKWRKCTNTISKRVTLLKSTDKSNKTMTLYNRLYNIIRHVNYSFIYRGWDGFRVGPRNTMHEATIHPAWGTSSLESTRHTCCISTSMFLAGVWESNGNTYGKSVPENSTKAIIWAQHLNKGSPRAISQQHYLLYIRLIRFICVIWLVFISKTNMLNKCR